MQKHEGNQATIYYLDMLGYIIVGIPLLLLLPASGIIQHPAVVCQAAVQCGVVELVLATRKTRCQGSPPCAGCCRAWRQHQPRYRNNAYSRSWSCSAPGLGPPPSCRPISCIYTDTGHCPAPMTHCGHCIHCILCPCCLSPAGYLHISATLPLTR